MSEDVIGRWEGCLQMEKDLQSCRLHEAGSEREAAACLSAKISEDVLIGYRGDSREQPTVQYSHLWCHPFGVGVLLLRQSMGPGTCSYFDNL